MPYIGRGPELGVRSRFIYTATANQTSFSGNDDAGISLAYTDTLYMDVYQNGVLLVPATDYAATTGTSVVLVQGASVDDTVELLVFDIFSVADSVSKKDGGAFSGSISASTVNATADTAAGANAAMGFTAAEGLILTGQGSTNDVTIKNDADEIVINIPTGKKFITQPGLPAFLVQPASTQSNLAINVDHDIAFATERFDRGSNFATPNFTSPVTGLYQFNIHIYFNQMDVDGTFYEIKLVTTAQTYDHVVDMRPYDADVPNHSFAVSILAPMDATDTAKVVVKPYNSGAAQVDVTTASHFSGYLVA